MGAARHTGRAFAPRAAMRGLLQNFRPAVKARLPSPHRAPALWAWLVFSVGFAAHYLPYLIRPKGFIFGDLTDGYFNLWILEHTARWLSGGGWEEFLHTRFFHPENQSVLLWSDNLLAPSLLYAACRAVGANLTGAYALTTLALIALGFWAHFAFFRALHAVALAGRTSPQKNTPWFTAPALLCALAAAMVSFSDSRLWFTIHFQNQFANLVLLGAAGLLNYHLDGRGRHLALSLSVWVALCYSAPYYALALALALGLFAPFFLRTRGIAASVKTLRSHGWMLAAAVLLVTPMAWGYLSVREAFSGQSGLSAPWWQVMVPPAETPPGRWLAKLGVSIPSRHIESLAYAGFLLAPLLAWFAAETVLRPLPDEPPARSLRLATALIAGTGLLLAAPAAPLAVGWWLALGGMLLGGAVLLARRGDGAVVSGWLLACAAVFYLTMCGPQASSPAHAADPSGWGVLAKLVPAYDSLRAVGRFGALGLSFALGAAWLHVWRWHAEGKSRRLAVLMGVIIASLLIDLPRRPVVRTYDFNALRPTAADQAFFAAHPGTLLVLPGDNLSLIPSLMIYFEAVPDVRLVNGYSGRFSSAVLRLHEAPPAGRHRVVAEVIAQTGADLLLLDHRAYGPEERLAIAASHQAEFAHASANFTVYLLSRKGRP